MHLFQVYAMAFIRFPKRPTDPKDSKPQSRTEQASPLGEKIQGPHVHLYTGRQGPIQALWPQAPASTPVESQGVDAGPELSKMVGHLGVLLILVDNSTDWVEQRSG